MKNPPEADVADLRVVGRDHLAHVIARALDVSTRNHQLRIPVTERYDLAEQIADSIERLGWQVLRPHWDPVRRDGS